LFLIYPLIFVDKNIFYDFQILLHGFETSYVVQSVSYGSA